MWSGLEVARAAALAGIALGRPVPNPLVGRSPGDAHLVSDVDDGMSGPETVDQESAAVNGRPGVGM